MAFLFQILMTALQIYSWILIIYILMSWFPGARESSFGEVLSRLAEPFLEPFRKIIPPLGMIDISPIVAILVLNFARAGLGELYYIIMGL
ncbi:YggT family protein [Halobacillus litoralis]|uniref:YggT family protein n=4 Tax=Halobacillus TaxID=45667 RepID=A0A845FAH9_9BACI|nr:MULTISPECIES: YggT family protein [Halobacillus]MBN9652771.1 YggT family protein [Halobacillus sp. GSS1]MBX0356523.1 YggT family protein [Halobacillus sp. Nhm2S1]MEC3882427.1 YggT family protein [Halobacillus sp. HZG1]MYL48782.1 YggT family protein [Halobacillus litoralis]MYL70889.1 YggT family protein [Halobacillus litoralis]